MPVAHKRRDFDLRRVSDCHPRGQGSMVSGEKKPRKYSESQQEKRAQRRNKNFERRGRILDEKEAAIRRRQADLERSVHEFEKKLAAQVSRTLTRACSCAPATRTCIVSTDFATRAGGC